MSKSAGSSFAYVFCFVTLRHWELDCMMRISGWYHENNSWVQMCSESAEWLHPLSILKHSPGYLNSSPMEHPYTCRVCAWSNRNVARWTCTDQAGKQRGSEWKRREINEYPHTVMTCCTPNSCHDKGRIKATQSGEGGEKIHWRSQIIQQEKAACTCVCLCDCVCAQVPQSLIVRRREFAPEPEE